MPDLLSTGCLSLAALQSFNGTNFTTPAQYNEFLKEHKNVFACEFVSSAWWLLSIHTQEHVVGGFSGVPMAPHGVCVCSMLPWADPQPSQVQHLPALPQQHSLCLPLGAALVPDTCTRLPPPSRPGINNQLLLALENSTDLSLNVENGNYTEAGVRPSAIDSIWPFVCFCVYG